MRYSDTFQERLEYSAKLELGVKFTDHKFLFVTNYLDSVRSHNVGLAFLCEIEDEPKDGKFFAKIPKDIIPEHKELWKLVRKVV